MVTQNTAIKIAQAILDEKKPFAVIYGYKIQRAINGKTQSEWLSLPIICETSEQFEAITKKFLSKTKVTRRRPNKSCWF